MTPIVLSELTFAIAAPSEDSLSALLAATFCPFFLKISIAVSVSPLASTKAFLQSIIPAPEIFLRLFTSDAVIFIIIIQFF